MKRQVIMQYVSVNCLMILLLHTSHAYSMEENGEYKVITTMGIPRALTLTTNAHNIAIGTACGGIKLYDIKGKLENNIAYCGDAGLIFDGNDGLISVSRKGKIFRHWLKVNGAQCWFCAGTTTYSIARDKKRFFLGSDNDSVHVWDAIDTSLDSQYVKTYTGTCPGQINALEVTDKAILKASSNGTLASVDRETGVCLWQWNPGYSPLFGLTKKDSLFYAGFKNGILVMGDPDRHTHDAFELKKLLYSLACLKSGYLAVGHVGHIGIYDIRKIALSLMELALYNKESVVTELKATENGFVAIVDHNTVQVWEEVQ